MKGRMQKKFVIISGIELVSRIFDVGSANLVEHNVCEECGYGTPALV